MVEQRTARLNQLEKDLPEGLVVDSAWLEAKGIPSNLRSYYVKQGWLEQPVRSVYRRPRGSLNWQQVVVSLQAMLGVPLIVGGKTALELQGFSHYLSRETRSIHLYGPQKPPTWLGKLDLPQTFSCHNSKKLFRNTPIALGLDSLAWDIASNTGHDLNRLQGTSFTAMAWGQWDWPLTLSRPERAFLEMLDELPVHESFDQADMIMQGAVNFSPRQLQKLLVDCSSVKVKRLFMFFADRYKHAWLKRLDKTKIDLGKGKRVLAKGGRLDPEYLITVPEDIDADH